MSDNNKNPGFKTDAFKEALKKNDERNNDAVSKDEPDPVENETPTPFSTDAFKEALKKHDEMNKDD